MNQRIRNLAEQAGYKPLSPPTFADELNEIFMRKFAELIVRECADIADRRPTVLINQTVGGWIKEHFGVER
jgi:hypothetical protein